MNIPEKILGLKYSKHAIRERCLDEFGTIEHAPTNFIKAGCKSVEPGGDTVIRATYIYNDDMDITLVIDVLTKIVITNYLNPANNKNVYRGRFRIGVT